MKEWLGFVGILMIRGVVMTLTGWVVVQLVREVWRLSIALGLVLWLMLIVGVGILYTMMERWP
jgi:hypothetical protein